MLISNNKAFLNLCDFIFILLCANRFQFQLWNKNSVWLGKAQEIFLIRFWIVLRFVCSCIKISNWVKLVTLQYFSVSIFVSFRNCQIDLNEQFLLENLFKSWWKISCRKNRFSWKFFPRIFTSNSTKEFSLKNFMKSKLYRFLSAFLFQYFRSINNLNYFSVYLKIKIDSNYARETNRKVKYNNINNEF